MARTTLAPQDLSLAGLNPTYSAVPAAGANNGVTIVNDGNVFLHVKNGNASSTVVTLDATGAVDGVPLTDPTISVPASGELMIGPFGQGAFSGSVAADFSVSTTVTVAAVRLPRA